MPLEDNSFDVVVFDPPYANRGTAKTREIDNRLRAAVKYRSPAQVEALLIDGTIEAMRVASQAGPRQVPGRRRGGQVPTAVVPRSTTP